MGKRVFLVLLLLAAGLMMGSACPARAVTEVRETEPSGSAGFLSGLMGVDWDGFTDAVIRARRNGEEEISVRLNGETFRDFLASGHLWYHAARAGLRTADCTYWEDGRVLLKDPEWWPWPMYLVHQEEDFTEAVRQRKGLDGETFGVLPDEALFRKLMGDERARNLLEYRSGLTDYKTMYYGEDECSFWYSAPRVGETVLVEASGLSDCARVLRETLCLNPAAGTVLAPDSATYRRLDADSSLCDDVFSAAGLCGSFHSNDQAEVYIFPPAEESCYPGFLIAESVRLGREKELGLVHQAVLFAARALIRDVRGTDLEKAAQIHDLLCGRITYTVDETTENDDCCIGALLNGKANCDGYADAFYLCASLSGLPVRYMSGNSLEDEGPADSGDGHIWNMFLADGTWRSVDLTWDDGEEDGISYEYFNLGLDRMAQEYDFTRELLPSPFAAVTDLQEKPVPEWTARNREELGKAVREALSAGRESIIIRCSDELFSAYLADHSVVAYAISANGAEAEEIWYSESSETVTLEGLRRMERWSFCRTREEIPKAVERMRDLPQEPFRLTLEEGLFADLFADPELTGLYMLLAKGGAVSAGLSWLESSRTVTVSEADWLDGWYAEDIGTVGDLSAAVRAGVKAGCREFYLALTGTLYRKLKADPSRLSQAVRDGGFREDWSYYYWDVRNSFYIVPDS